MKRGGLLLLSLGFLLVLSLSVVAQTTRVVYKVEVTELFISPFELQCTEKINGVVTVINKGNLDATVSAALINDDLGIEAYSPTIRLPPGRQQGIVLPFTLDKETIGAYAFTIILYTDEGIEQLFQTITFRGCPKPTLTSLIPEVQLEEEQQEEEITPLSTPFLIAIILGGLLACLSVLFLIVSYLQEAQQAED